MHISKLKLLLTDHIVKTQFQIKCAGVNTMNVTSYGQPDKVFIHIKVVV